MIFREEVMLEKRWTLRRKFGRGLEEWKVLCKDES